ncbi:hypothetical protein [uncultured Aquimarina sp.]|uniref:hypothetical protein n=1 Tax=uncultured Aquimarina sp. TaxID=575652 RepID=UPI002630E0B1|nr:hypothetical protein [uncultured Aquimarina sp.]
MKRIFLVLMILLSGYLVKAQDANSEEEKDVNLFSFPVSPEAGRLGTYGNVPVNLSTGQMNFPVPIYTINEKGYSWPISLSYNFKGLVYEDKPSVTGLGWNLQAGGVVTREVRGIPDEHPKGYYGESQIRQQLLDPYFSSRTISKGTADLLMNGELDGEADKYYVSVNGISFSFKIGLDKAPVYLSEHNHKVILDWATPYELNGFEVLDHNGIQYFFEGKEYNEPTNIGSNWQVYNDSFMKYISSWNLTKVVFPNKEELTFNYQSRDYYSYDHFASGGTHSADIQCGTNSFTDPFYSDGFAKTKIVRKILTQISSSTARIDFGVPFQTGPNSEGYCVTYSNILVRNNYDNTILWDYDLSYEGPRDVLTSITRNEEHFYSFDYHYKNLVPAFTNSEDANVFKQDLWGFYNGINNQYGVNIAGTSFTANKNSSLSHTMAGALKRITYPTKGYSDISYEQNTAKTPYQEVLNSGQSFSPNWQIFLELETDPAKDSGKKEKKFTYTFTETTVADIKHILNALPTSFSGISITKKDPCIGDTNSSTSYQHYARHLRAIGDDNIPEFCPRLYDVVDDGDTDGNYNELVRKSQSTNGQIKIPAGTYEFKIWTDRSHKPMSGWIRVRFYQPIVTGDGVVTPEFTNKMVGGIRISRVSHYTSENKLGSSKLYEYKDESGFSSGNELQKAILFHNYNVQYGCDTGPNVQGTSQCHLYNYYRSNYTTKSFNNLNLNTGIPILYTQVREIDFKQVKQSFSRSSCNTEDCIDTTINDTSDSILTYIGSEEDMYGGTSPSTYIYPNGYKVTRFITDDIGQDSYPSIPSVVDLDMGRMSQQLVLKYNEKNDSLIPLSQSDYIYQQLIGNKGSNYPKSIKIAYKFKQEGDCFYMNPEYTASDYYRLIPYSELNKKHQQTQTISKQYFPEEVTTTQTLSYDAYYQVEKSETTDSKGRTIEIENFYPYDGQMQDGGLLEANIYTTVLGSITKQDGEIIGQSRTDYGVINERTNGKIIRPMKLWAATGGEPLRGITKYDQYDDYGNLLQYFKIITDGTSANDTSSNPLSDEGGILTAAIWGYDHTYPIAQIINASYEQAVAQLSVSMEQLQNLDGDALRLELDNIRQGLPNAQITTYTFKPQVGVTSVTDPRGYTMYYEYDSQYRLQFVKDEDGNLISENQYKYRSN